MCVVIEILPVGKPVIGLKNVHRAGFLELIPKLFQRDRELNVRQVFDGDDRYAALREWLKAQWRKRPEARDAPAAAIFEELALAEGGHKAHLLESERFLALLSEPELARAA